ncbi:MAG: deoxyribose-phosphate aldolase [Lachnospiraceae bacterium]|nr:deoxyribose-phosphate aldolase [Lachnospiraceae bacterium]
MTEQNIQKILSVVDHTNLKVDATWEDIKAICDDGIKYQTASVCIPPAYVKRAKEYVGEELKICTVIGFPNGYNTTPAKVFETTDAVKNGADEIDMVINIGKVKDADYEYVQREIEMVKMAAEDKILKVIVETCLLTDEEIARLCEVVYDAKADYIKTSTGFNKEGATIHAVDVMNENRPEGLKIKAAGGISSLEDALEFMEHGADRLGTSRVVKIVKETCQ